MIGTRASSTALAVSAALVWLSAIASLNSGPSAAGKVSEGWGPHPLLGDQRRLEHGLADRVLGGGRFILLPADQVRLVLAHRNRVEPHPGPAHPGHEEDPAGRTRQSAERIGAESRVEHIILVAVIPERQLDLFEGHALGPWRTGKPRWCTLVLGSK